MRLMCLLLLFNTFLVCTVCISILQWKLGVMNALHVGVEFAPTYKHEHALYDWIWGSFVNYNLLRNNQTSVPSPTQPKGVSWGSYVPKVLEITRHCLRFAGNLGWLR